MSYKSIALYNAHTKRPSSPPPPLNYRSMLESRAASKRRMSESLAAEAARLEAIAKTLKGPNE